MLFASWMLGCASVSPFNQSFVELRSPHFIVTSSLGESATHELARDLEVFHAGVLEALGIPLGEQGGQPTRVLAFDGRGMARPFAIRGQGASLVPGLDGPTLMIRTNCAFSQCMRPDLRHRYAHYVLRAVSARRAPLWYEEGRAQVSSTIDVSGSVARVGRFAEEKAVRLLEWRRSDLSRVLERRQVATESLEGRLQFEAETWALVHTVLFDSPRKRPGREALDRVRRAFEADRPRELAAAVRALGSPESLTDRIYRHLESERHRADRLQVGLREISSLPLRPLEVWVARDQLGQLALSLSRFELALDYFDRALAASPDSEAPMAGRAQALAALGRHEEARAALRGLDSGDWIANREGLGPPPFAIANRVGSAHLVLAIAASTDATRERARAAARAAFSRALEASPENVVAMVGMGRTQLGVGGDSDAACAFFDAARELRPGALEIDLWLAACERDRGRDRAARGWLEEVLSRSHSSLLLQRAEERLLELEEGEAS